MAATCKSDIMGDAERIIGKSSGHIHLVGACGVGMAGLGILLNAEGFRVTGCDCSPGLLAERLAKHGIDVVSGHDPAHLTDSVICAVRSSAVPLSSPELCAAASRSIPVIKRGEMLAALLAGRPSVGIAGTHGKTTTAAFIAQILKDCGLSPGLVIGGEVDRLGGGAAAGGSVVAFEADESDGTLALYAPELAVITNVEADHLENFRDLQELMDCFRSFARATRKKLLYCSDQATLCSLCADLSTAVSWGFEEGAFYRGRELEISALASAFALSRGGEQLGILHVPVPGRHNALNALAAAAVALEMDIPFSSVRAAVAQLALPRRRFEQVLVSEDLLVVSDYAHHPTEISALVATARGYGRRRILAMFQPHRYSRTLAMGPEFPGAFDGVDKLVLVPVYAASELPTEGGAAADLYVHFRRSTTGPGCTALASSLRAAWEGLRRDLAPGDILLVAGAGDIEQVAQWAKAETRLQSGKLPVSPTDDYRIEELASSLETSVVRTNEPLAGKTTMGVGGVADVWIEIGSTPDLRSVLSHVQRLAIPFRLIGAGSNLLVSDLGVRGIIGKLAGPEFDAIEMKADIISVGSAVGTNRLLAWLQEHGLGGLEFLRGIPGTVGGAVRMNAGAFGGQTGSRVAWVRVMNEAGEETIDREPRFAYRSGVSAACILAAGFAVTKADDAASRRIRAEIDDKRAWLRGLRCAGSVFLNPENDAAGRLLDVSGLKGLTVGGAQISDVHANVIVTEKGACASDVLALIEIARNRVKSRFNVDLKNEIVILADSRTLTIRQSPTVC